MIKVNFFGKQILSFEASNRLQLTNEIIVATKLKSDEFYLLRNGKLLTDHSVNNGAVIDMHLRTLGGKGGFGSMLRAIGAQIEKTTNREACRDLSGRRLRDINEEKRLKAWLEKQKSREAEAEEKKKRKVAKLLHVPKHEFKDAQYEEARSKLTEKVNDAVEEGFKKSIELQNGKANLKRKAETASSVKKKKANLWIGEDIDGSSATDSDESDNSIDDNKPTTSKKKDD